MTRRISNNTPVKNPAEDPIHQQLRLYKQKQGLGPELEQLSEYRTQIAATQEEQPHKTKLKQKSTNETRK